MNTYRVTATRSDGTEISDNFTEPTENTARKSFKECYRHETYTITGVELINDNAQASKQQEREALEKIKKLVESLGPDSYLATAFTGCFSDAEENIENDFATSMYGRWQYAEEELEKTKAALTETADKLAAATERMSDLETRCIGDADLVACINTIIGRRNAAFEKMSEKAVEIVNFAENPENCEFRDAVVDHRELGEEIKRLDALKARLENTANAGA